MPQSNIIVREEYNGGEPSLTSGYTVLQVVELLEEEQTVDDVADWLEIPEEEVEAAHEYYQENEAEIEEIRQEKKAIAEEYSITSV